MRSLEPQPHQAFIQERLAPWFIKAHPQQRRLLTQSMVASHLSRAQLAEFSAGVLSVLEFSRPLLTQALDDEFGPGLDPEQARFFQARFKKGSLNGRRSPDRSRVQTLMQAALQNFEAKEAIEAGKESTSVIYHRDPALREVDLPSVEPASVSPKKFIEVCRRLDLGGRYQRYLESKLSQPDLEQVKALFVNRERDVLRVEANIAYMKELISKPFHTAILALDTPGVKPTVGGKPFVLQYFTVLGVSLRGVLVFQGRGQNACVVYMPSQPSEPLKEFAHFGEFMDQLRENARTPQYRQYLKQLIPLRSRALFFARLENCLNPYVTRSIPGSSGLIKPRIKAREPNLRANLNAVKNAIAGELPDYFYLQHMLRIKDDARALAVPTGDENEKSRKERLASFLENGMDVLNLASIVLPGLGEAMLLMAGSQWLVETFEGIDAWSHGQMTEALEHLCSVAESVAMTALLSKAALLSTGLVPPIKASSFIDAMVTARSRDGVTRLSHAPAAVPPSIPKPAFKMPTRLPDGRLGYLLSGRGRGATGWHADPQQNLINAMTALFPEVTNVQAHVDWFVMIGEDLETMTLSTQRRLEDYQALHSALDAWVEPMRANVPSGNHSVPIREQARQTRQTFADALCQAWRYSDDDAPRGPDILLLESLDLTHLADLPDLPSQYSQIRFLTLRAVLGDVEQLDSLLRQFSGLTRLAMVDGGLQELPTALTVLEHLYSLSVAGQGLAIDQSAMNLLMDIPQLSSLNLRGNVVGEFTDTSRLRLSELTLGDTGLTRWPHWVDALNLRELDVSDNLITSLPEVILDNVLDPFHHTTIFAAGNPINTDELRAYWLNAGYGRRYTLEFEFPEEIRALPSAHSNDRQSSTGSPFTTHSHSIGGAEFDTTPPCVDSWIVEGRAELNSRIRSAWERVHTQGDAPNLMNLLHRLRETADFQQFHEELANDVMTVLEAAADDTPLRGQLEIMASDRLFGPDQTCQDGARLIFSDMQVAVYAHTALLGVPAEQQTERLFSVIRSMFRLDQVRSIADVEIRRQTSTGVHVDQAEVRLAYRIGLASYLALPGQPLRMVWEGLSNVAPQAILDARRLILEREAGPAFLDFAVNDRLWNARLRAENAVQVEHATSQVRAQMDALEEHPPADPDQYHRQGLSLISLRDADEREVLEQITHQYRQAWY